MWSSFFGGLNGDAASTVLTSVDDIYISILIVRENRDPYSVQLAVGTERQYFSVSRSDSRLDPD